MSDRFQPQGSQPQQGWQNMRWEAGANGAPQELVRTTALQRFIGGSPLAVFLRLLALSLCVGALLMWLDIQPFEIFRAVERFIHRIWLMGFDAIREIANYVLAGAIIVVPVWLLLRLMNMPRK